MKNGGAASSSYAAAPAAGADPAIRLSELPDHLVSRLSVLYVTNVPTTVNLSEARTFFDDCGTYRFACPLFRTSRPVPPSPS